MGNSSGTFVWYELLTTDAPAAIAFYTGVIGWQPADSGLSDRSYTRLSAGSIPVAGLMPLPPAARDAGSPPFWIGYIGVDDVDGAVAGFIQAGGALHRPTETIPGVGRFAVVADPQGAPLTLFTPDIAAMSEPPPAPSPMAPGHVGWHELHAADGDTAFAFYAAQFGWTQAGSMDMGTMGLYRMFASGAAMAGGIMTKSDSFPRPAWVYYFNVDQIEAAIGRAKTAGGQLINGPHQVPTGQWIAHCLDPQGAFFAMVAPDHSA